MSVDRVPLQSRNVGKSGQWMPLRNITRLGGGHEAGDDRGTGPTDAHEHDAGQPQQAEDGRGCWTLETLPWVVASITPPTPATAAERAKTASFVRIGDTPEVAAGGLRCPDGDHGAPGRRSFEVAADRPSPLCHRFCKKNGPSRYARRAKNAAKQS